MNSAHVARHILADMWQYGRLVLLIAFGSLMWGCWISRYTDDSDPRSLQSGLLYLALATVGGFVLFSFLNVETEALVALTHANPAWGWFTGLVTLLMCGCVVLVAYKQFVASRTESHLSILETEEGRPRLYPRGFKWIFVGVALLMLSSIFWLWRIAG